MKRTWTARELRGLADAHRRRVCGLNPAWGKCAHPQCHEMWRVEMWRVTQETANDEEVRAIFGELFNDADPRTR
jgi:hypothetical protein